MTRGGWRILSALTIFTLDIEARANDTAP